MKTLIVSYLGRGDDSYTKKLLDAFKEEVNGSEIEYLDLVSENPDYFVENNLSAYILRNYMGKTLSGDLKESISKMDRMTEQFKQADAVVLATPMYNFSLPGAVKSWFDSIILKGETWDMDKSGYKGLMKGKKALVLMASGSAYEGPMESWDHAMPLAKQLFKFMGFEEVEDARVQGTNMNPDKLDQTVKEAKEKVKEIAKKWYS